MRQFADFAAQFADFVVKLHETLSTHCDKAELLDK